MTIRLVLLAAAGGLALSTGALALPFNRLSADDAIVQARTICDEQGRCWRADNPVEEFTDGMLRGFEGRSIHRDVDRDRRMNRDRDRDREDYDRRDFR